MTNPTHFSVEIERTLIAPRALVFANWIEAEQLGAWFAPKGFDVLDCTVDARPGGVWRVVYSSPAGERYTEHGEFVEIASPEYLRLTLTNQNAHGEVTVRTEVQVHFEEQNGLTTMKFVQTGLTSAPLRDGMREGWNSCFDKLEQQIGAESELRELFEKWFRASETKDLDASMAPIAKDILAYEHDAPLAHRGVEALRRVCQAGLEAMPDRFRWDVPDLKIIVRGDLAVTWGLNRMKGEDVEYWSRGTRVFQRLDGRWQLIHQHVSFPYDPESGMAKVNLRPEDARHELSSQL